MEAIVTLNFNNINVGEIVKVDRVEDNVAIIIDPYDYVDDSTLPIPLYNVVVITDETRENGVINSTSTRDIAKLITAIHYLNRQPQSTSVKRWREGLVVVLLGQKNNDIPTGFLLEVLSQTGGGKDNYSSDTTTTTTTTTNSTGNTATTPTSLTPNSSFTNLRGLAIPPSPGSYVAGEMNIANSLSLSVGSPTGGSAKGFSSFLAAKKARIAERIASIFSSFLSSSSSSSSSFPSSPDSSVHNRPTSFEGSLETFTKHLTSPSPSDFIRQRMLGKGAYGKVVGVTIKADTSDSYFYAMKQLNKRTVIDDQKGSESVLEERNALIRVAAHPFVTRLFCALQTPTDLILVMEIALGGDLGFHIKNNRVFTAADIHFYAAELLLALAYLHSEAISLIHRDVKPSNVLITRAGHVKLSDFGLACDARSDNACSQYAGTARFAAPEMYRRQRYGHGVDLWSLGQTLFLCATRRMIWQPEPQTSLPAASSSSAPAKEKKKNPSGWLIDKKELKTLMATGTSEAIKKRFGWPADMDADLRELLAALLSPNPDSRPTAQGAMAFPFFRSVADWSAYERNEVTPTFLPSPHAGLYFNPILDIEGDADLGYFPYAKAAERPLTSKEQKLFEHFDWVLK